MGQWTKWYNKVVSAQKSKWLEYSRSGWVAMGKVGEVCRAQIIKDLSCGANELGLLYCHLLKAMKDGKC